MPPRKARVKGIPRDDIIDFLEGSFGAFQKKHAASGWTWDRARLSTVLAELATHKLVEAAEHECYHLTELGRFAGQGGVEVESIIRVVEALAPLAPGAITDPTLIAAAQLTLELDRENFPLNKRGWKKETETWFMELRRQHIPAHVLQLLHRFVSEQHTAAQRAKRPRLACSESPTSRCPPSSPR